MKLRVLAIAGVFLVLGALIMLIPDYQQETAQSRVVEMLALSSGAIMQVESDLEISSGVLIYEGQVSSLKNGDYEVLIDVSGEISVIFNESEEKQKIEIKRYAVIENQSIIWKCKGYPNNLMPDQCKS